MRPGSEARQHQILNAAAICFARNGFHQTTMQAICAEASLSPGSVYRYYASKEELIGALIDEERAESLALIERVSREPDPVAGLRSLINTILAAIDLPQAAVLDIEVGAEAARNPAVAARVRQNYEDCTTALATMLRRSQEQGTVDPGLDPEATAALLLSVFDGLTMQRALGLPFDADVLGPTLATLIERLLRPQEEQP